MRSCANLVVAGVLVHNKKVQRVSALHEKKKKMAEKLIELHSLYKSLFKIIPEKRNGRCKIEEF